MKKALFLILVFIVILTGFVFSFFLPRKTSTLDAFYQWTREDPLFTSPYFDMQGYNTGLKLLKENNKKFEETSGRKEKIFPFAFLESLPDVYKNEQKFLKNPSHNNAQNLIKAYKKTALAYKSEADSFYKTLNDHKDLIGKLKFVFIDTYTTTDILLSVVEKIKKNGEALVEEVNLRQKCLENIKFCKKPSLSWNMPELKSTALQLDLLPKDILFPTLSTEELGKVRGPYSVLSPCWGWGENFASPPVAFYISPRTRHFQNEEIFAPKLAQTNYYRKLANSPSSTEKKENTWVWQPDTNNYLCGNLVYQPKLATMDYFWQNFKDKPLLANKPKNLPLKLWFSYDKAQKYEQDFFKLKMPDEKSLEELSELYLYLYRSWKKEDIAQKNLLLERGLLIERSLGNFPLVFNKGIYHFVNVLRQEKESPGLSSFDKYFYSYVFLYRNPWQILYIPYSSSFWRIEQKPEYLEKGRVKTTGENGLYINYKQALGKFTAEEIKNLHKGESEVFFDQN